MRLSLKLSDTRISGVDSKVGAIDEVKEAINKQPLESLLANIPTSIRSLPLVGENRSFTMIPGSEAYSHVSYIYLQKFLELFSLSLYCYKTIQFVTTSTTNQMQN